MSNDNERTESIQQSNASETPATTRKRVVTIDERTRQTRERARKEVASRGNVQFRLDEATMLRLMDMSDAQKKPLGVLARIWVEERLAAEEKALANQAAGEEPKQ